ncbi:co-chaperone GrpE [Bacteroidales bacterium KA00251]|nr:co-chaperone GrpE [Bacteroidales bacterium KA00251]
MSKEKKMADKKIDKDLSERKIDEKTKGEVAENEQIVQSDKEESHLEDELTVLKEQLASLNDRYLRISAEYENYRRRTAKEKSDLMTYGGEKVLSALLPVVDDLELALHNIDRSDDLGAIKQGIELIAQKFFTFLQKHGVEQMDVLQKPFDMASQQAIAMVKTDNPEEKGIVLDCTKKGYTLHEKILRFADVVVGE